MEGNAIVSNDVLTEIADAIREKLGSEDEMSVTEMADNIRKIETGGVEPDGELVFDKTILKTTVSRVTNNAFEASISLHSVSLPSCMSVGINSFCSCTELHNVNLPACESLGYGAFSDCFDLPSIALPACREVGERAFANVWQLESVSLPSCTQIGSGAFEEDYEIKNIDLSAMTIEQVSNGASDWAIPSGCTVKCSDGEITIE